MRRAGCAVLLAFGILACGCGGGGTDGPERVSVSGTVTFDGTPVEQGEIRFVSEGEGSTDAASITNGSFTASVTPGSKRVEILASRLDPDNMVESGVNPGQMEPASVQYIPEQYNSASTLTANITSDGDNELPTFELKSAGD